MGVYDTFSNRAHTVAVQCKAFDDGEMEHFTEGDTVPENYPADALILDEGCSILIQKRQVIAVQEGYMTAPEGVSVYDKWGKKYETQPTPDQVKENNPFRKILDGRS